MIFKQDKSVIPNLEKLAEDNNNAITAIHALHTLDGLDALNFDFLKKVATSNNPMLSAHALLLLRKYNSQSNSKPMDELAQNLLNRKDSVIDLYIALSLEPWIKESAKLFFPVLSRISERYADKGIYNEAIVSSLNGAEKKFQSFINRKGSSLDSLLSETAQNRVSEKINSIFRSDLVPIDSRTMGMSIFRSTCATCHGMDGEGMVNVGPPLRGSQYLSGPSEKLAMIILHGLEGPIHVNGQLYNFNGSMPNFGNNFSDKDIKDIIEYLHNYFVPERPKGISPDKVKELRNKRQGTLTEKDLLEMK